SEPALMIVISSLQSNGLLTTTGDNNQHYLPGQSLDHITVKMILDAARSAEETARLRPDDVDSGVKVEDIILALEKAQTEITDNTTLKDLI
ncbi:MAG: hypothetical protein KJO91_12550, partial [Gammaproteobacteria bacterium]|nr:hypothetical protein [Gammaproteobacteria bacterium]